MMMPMFRVAIVCAAALGLAAKPASCEPLPYTLEDNVVVVHDRNFETVVSEHRTVLLEFYAPWCGHCKNLVPEYAAVGKFIHRGQEASGEFNMIVAKSDATANRNLAMAQSVSSYPTILLFQNGALVEKYSGERSFEDIMEYVKDMDASCARDDGNKAPMKAQSSARPVAASNSDAPPKRSFRYAPDELVASGFVSIVDSQSAPELEASDKPWLIAVFKNGCGHCRRMEGEWTEALRALSASGAAAGVHVGVLDAEQLDRESPIMSILPGFRGTPAFFSYVPPSMSPNGKAESAYLVTASRAGEMVSTVASRLAKAFFGKAENVAAVEAVAAAQPRSVAHDLTFVLITSPANPLAASQATEFRALAAQKATGMFLHAGSPGSAAVATHFGVEVSGVQSVVVALDSRKKKVPGHVVISSETAVDEAWLGVSHWIQFKVATAFQWMSPVNQGNYFEGIKSLEGLTKTGWATEDASARITTAATIMLADFPDDDYVAIVDEARVAHPNTVFYFQLGDYLQRRFLYGLHCPDVATLPCINVHPVSSPFSDVLRLSKLLEGSNADRYSADPRSSLLHILEDFKNGRVRRESFNVMDNIKTFGKIKAMALERGEDVNSPLNPSEYPPLSGPIPGDASAPSAQQRQPKPSTGASDQQAKDAAHERKLRIREEQRKARAASAASSKTEQGSDTPMPKPKPKPKSGSAGGQKSEKKRLQQRLDRLSQMVAELQKEIADWQDEDEWE